MWILRFWISSPTWKINIYETYYTSEAGTSVDGLRCLICECKVAKLYNSATPSTSQADNITEYSLSHIGCVLFHLPEGSVVLRESRLRVSACPQILHVVRRLPQRTFSEEECLSSIRLPSPVLSAFRPKSVIIRQKVRQVPCFQTASDVIIAPEKPRTEKKTDILRKPVDDEDRIVWKHYQVSCFWLKYRPMKHFSYLLPDKHYKNAPVMLPIARK